VITIPKIRFIVNKSASGGRCVFRWRIVQKEIKKLGITNFDVKYTQLLPLEQIKHSYDPRSTAYQLAQEAANAGYELIVNVGGDGTLNEIFNGVLTSKHPSTPILPLPIGTGNDIPAGAELHYHPKDLTTVLQALKPQKRDIKLIDVGLVNDTGRYFAGAVGVGFDALTTYISNTQRKILRGSWNYILGLIRALKKFQGQNIRITIDNKHIIEKKIYLAALGIGTRYGAGMKVCPLASPTDGKFDITVVKKLSRMQLIVAFPKVYTGNHIYIKEWIEIAQGKQVRIESIDNPGPVLVQADGEVLGTLPATFTNIPKKLHLAFPKPYPKEI